MKESIVLRVPYASLASVGEPDWEVSLTRTQLENAIKEINRPDPLKPGDKVTHLYIGPTTTFLVLHHQVIEENMTTLANLANGEVNNYRTSNLRKVEP